MNTPVYRNTLLHALPSDVVARLHPLAEIWEVNHEFEYPGKTITHCYFVENGMASMTATFANGGQVEVCMFGFESIVGVSALMGTKRSLNRVYTQIAGDGFSCKLDAVLREFKRGEVFHDLALRYVQAQLVQSMQSTGCNAKHHLDERLARWLLLCADRAHSLQFKISQEFLSDMLGTTRPTVSIAAGLLKEAGLIDYTRGLITILDSAGLERHACECYKVIKDHLDNYAEFDSGISA